MNYQLTYIVPTEVSDLKELEKIIEAINGIVAKAGGQIKTPVSGIIESQFNENFRNDAEIKRIVEAQKVDIFKHRLAYPIKHHRYGYYVSVIFGLENKDSEAIIKALSSNLKHNKNILRTTIDKYELDRINKQIEERKRIRSKEEAAAPAESEASEVKAEEAPEETKKEENLLTEESKKSKIEDLDKKLEQILNA